ncbi:MAG TPA: type II toxin-antitoxin system Phd/YefM family antitoxin [Chlorobaculum sp.]|jgi:prevent-host-death family protein|nr:type II toxin-antitoxin system Phd/YefM family antitoxin [Chlorobaculum sp.]
MDRIDLENDIRPLSEFRANTASLVTQVRKTGRPLVLTQHGKSAVVLLDVRLYQTMVSAFDRSSVHPESGATPVKKGRNT